MKGNAKCKNSRFETPFGGLKGNVLRIGPRCEHNCAPLTLSGSKLAYVEQTKYLGVILKLRRSFKCALDHVKAKLNSIALLMQFCIGLRMPVLN